MLKEELNSAHDAFAPADIRGLNPLQMAYVGDTVHDLYVRSMLLSRGMAVGKMHRQAVRMVSAGAQARMLERIEPELTQEEADIARRGRNSQAKHAAPRHADPADYAHATALEALWGYLYLSGQTQRLDELMKLALTRTEDVWQKQT
ncbi:MAG: ribonuclease III [Clostridiales bacterium]|nr:ribonuclease III [Clostridiales bacterium]MDY3763114.1 ribonuclease III domain-containing protein [Candidatus Ventricola sp.]MDY3832075.1 ribonuclease III domain-containing protein [Candidatus Ventricola sp.]MDY4854875.1 ribonuclease III domain-containing protein [Candidatus Ventricola sp.]